MQLKDYPVFHAGRRKMRNPELNREVLSQTAVRYMRFLRTVKINYLELSVLQTPPGDARGNGRWIPKVPTHPAHLIISSFDRDKNEWICIKEVELPPNPKFLGEGLSQDMSIEEMEDFFSEAVGDQPPHKIDLDGLETECIKVECDREHPVWANHGECNGGAFNVPFGILNPLQAFGEELEELAYPEYHQKLERAEFAPFAPDGMTVNTENPLEVSFSGKKLSIAFSLMRPMLTHLSWDYFGEGKTSNSRLLFKRISEQLGGLNGPSYITPAGNFCTQNMSGKVSVIGNQIRYYNLDAGCGITLDATFTVTAESITLEIEQNAEKDTHVIEAEAWRLLWNMNAGMTSVAGVPVKKDGRNGFVQLPAMIAADDRGCLSVELREGNGTLHTESYRFLETRSTSFALLSSTSSTIIPKGKSRAVFELKPSILLPVPEDKLEELSEGLKKSWTAGFSAFRPEFGGFSNNSISTNCHVNQHVAFDYAAFTSQASNTLIPVDLVKFSIERALMDGGGYGYHRNLYMDSDPVLVSGAGRIYQLSKDKSWLEYVKPGIITALKRIINNFNPEEGMIVSKALSGNSGTYRWSSNSMDVVGFGHIDAYVNAWSFRAMKNGTALMKILGENNLSEKCKDIATALSENYSRQLVNPDTGWVSGWKSRDGQLHDFGFLWINAIACAFGVMDDKETRTALENLEEKRKKVFPESGYLGIPLNLLPIKETDHMLSQSDLYKLIPSFENYTDGALCPCFAGYYIRALSAYGLNEQASQIAFNLEKAFAAGKFHGPYGTGKEFMTWTGADSGYEGTFGVSFSPLYAIAVQRGIIKPTTPEWWIE